MSCDQSLLDLTAAFYSVDHDILLTKLCGLPGVVLDWFRSYLSGRTFRVIFGGQTSSSLLVLCSLLQGSVPRLFILYTADLEDKVEERDVNFHAFSYDTELNVYCRRDHILPAIQRLERCIDEMATGCLQIDCSLMQRGLSCCGLV